MFIMPVSLMGREGWQGEHRQCNTSSLSSFSGVTNCSPAKPAGLALCEEAKKAAVGSLLPLGRLRGSPWRKRLRRRAGPSSLSAVLLHPSSMPPPQPTNPVTSCAIDMACQNHGPIAEKYLTHAGACVCVSTTWKLEDPSLFPPCQCQQGHCCETVLCADR